MAVVTVDELQAYMAGLKMRAVEKNAAALILDGVQGEPETYLYRAIEPRHVREVAICDFRGVVILSRTPVSRIGTRSRRGWRRTPRMPASIRRWRRRMPIPPRC